MPTPDLNPVLSPPDPKEDVGVIVGRFQTPWLHEGHHALIQSVRRLHGRIIVILGVSPVRNSMMDPLDVRSRRRMIWDSYADVDIDSIMDMADDTAWSLKLDKLVASLLTPHQTARYYGGRDSFIEHYKGNRPTSVLEAKQYYSASAVRKEVRTNYPASKDFRAGMVSASAERYPTAYQTVDVAIFKGDNDSEILLGRKPDEKRWRLIGGFSDPESDCLETDARREAYEETGLSVGGVRYLFSTLVDDWRYRNGKDKIKTAVFYAKYTHGRPEGGDDIAEVRWFKIDELNLRNDIVATHQPLFMKLFPKHPNLNPTMMPPPTPGFEPSYDEP